MKYLIIFFVCFLPLFGCSIESDFSKETCVIITDGEDHYSFKLGGYTSISTYTSIKEARYICNQMKKEKNKKNWQEVK